jgi:tRNA-uridine 2-sulfurtransferase
MRAGDGADPKLPSAGSAYGGEVGARLKGGVRAGRLPNPSGVGQAGSAECGALVRVEIAVEGGVVVDAGYQAYGCPATLACAAAVADKAAGLPLIEAARLGSAEISAAVNLATDKMYSAELAVDALHAALGRAVLTSTAAGGGPEGAEAGVLVGMSGGVDSSVAALLLQRQGYRPVGVTLSLWNDPHAGGERSCCSPETVRRARRVAHSLGLPHITLDASEVFSERVVEYFVSDYGRGRTPNPCAKCNARVRFGLMVDVAGCLGLTWTATGHYARLLGARRVLARGVDALKDQSYVLAEVNPAILRRVLFPLGEMTKQEVRAVAAEARLEGHAVPESQEICFIPDDDHRRFLRSRLGERPGNIVDSSGRVLGTHGGTYNYTIGQRKGLGIASEAPLYVLGIDADRALVLAGPEGMLDVSRVDIGDVTWHTRPAPGAVSLQVRSSGMAFPGCLSSGADGPENASETVTVALHTPARGVACGQTGVVYQGDQVVCAGTIIETR